MYAPFRDETSHIPRCMYGCFVRGWRIVVIDRTSMFWAFRYVVNAKSCTFDCWGTL